MLHNEMTQKEWVNEWFNRRKNELKNKIRLTGNKEKRVWYN